MWAETSPGAIRLAHGLIPACRAHPLIAIKTSSRKNFKLRSQSQSAEQKGRDCGLWSWMGVPGSHTSSSSLARRGKAAMRRNRGSALCPQSGRPPARMQRRGRKFRVLRKSPEGVSVGGRRHPSRVAGLGQVEHLPHPHPRPAAPPDGVGQWVCRQLPIQPRGHPLPSLSWV